MYLFEKMVGPWKVGEPITSQERQRMEVPVGV